MRKGLFKPFTTRSQRFILDRVPQCIRLGEAQIPGISACLIRMHFGLERKQGILISGLVVILFRSSDMFIGLLKQTGQGISFSQQFMNMLLHVTQKICLLLNRNFLRQNDTPLSFKTTCRIK